MNGTISCGKKKPYVITKLRIKTKCYVLATFLVFPCLLAPGLTFLTCLYMFNELFVTKLTVAHSFYPKTLSTLKKA